MHRGAALSFGLIRACRSGLALYSIALSDAGGENDGSSAISERSLLCIVGYCTGALWDVWHGSIPSTDTAGILAMQYIPRIILIIPALSFILQLHTVRLTHWCLVDGNVLRNDYLITDYEVGLRYMRQIPIYNKLTLIQLMPWCRKGTSHYLNQCWPGFMLRYGIRVS